MGKQGGGGSSSMEAPPLSRYPMMRSPMGGQQPTNSNTQMYSSGGQFGASSRSIGSRPLSMGHSPSIVGQKRDSSGFAVMGGGSGPALHGGPGQGGASQDSTDGGNFVKLFVGSVPRTVIEDDARKRIPWTAPPRVLGGSEPAPPPLPKSLSDFLSDEKIDQMDKLSLRRALIALNLPTSGRIETLRKRLKGAQENAIK